jgi:hypothetical protein
MKNHNTCDSYRLNWDLFKVLLGFNLLSLKLLLCVAQMCSSVN